MVLQSDFILGKRISCGLLVVGIYSNYEMGELVVKKIQVGYNNSYYNCLGKKVDDN